MYCERKIIELVRWSVLVYQFYMPLSWTQSRFAIGQLPVNRDLSSVRGEHPIPIG